MPSEANAALMEWYQDNHRPFPWRETKDPWAILISEVMSQQTQISRVEERFGPFMERFPTPQALAEASTAEVLQMWSGMGYNQRGLRLQQAALYVVEHGWPQDLEELPGVGPYTAAAVGSISFGRKQAAVDTNVKRVVSRWVGRALSGSELQGAANDLVSNDAATWNQAVMDLGARFCTPRPSCHLCPIQTWCADPTVYVPPARQSTFAGSNREARGAVVRTLTKNPQGMTVAKLSLTTDIDQDRIGLACGALVQDKLVVKVGRRYALPS